MQSPLISLATPGAQSLRPYEPGMPIEELEREYGVTNSIKLASNENPLGAGAKALAALSRDLTNIHLYPDGNGFALKQSLAQHLGVAAEQITLGNGSNDVLDLVARAYANHEHEIVYSAYSFVVYALATQAVGARAVITEARGYGHDLAAMAAAVTAATRVIYVANPNNPTGTWNSAEEVRALLEAVPKHVIVVIDEAYCEYVSQPSYPNCLGWLAEFDNLMVTRTFSKIHGLAGIRVGYGVSHRDVADVLNRVRQPFNVSSPALRAALAALDDDEHVARSAAINQAGLAQLTIGCERLGLNVIPSVGNFLSIDFGRDAAPIYEALLHLGVIVRPIAGYGLPHHLRVTVGRAHENARFLEALATVLAPD